MAELAYAVADMVENRPSHFHTLYTNNLSVQEKIETIATKIYGANGVTYAAKAQQQLKQLVKLGFEHFPVCMAKTPKSFSDNEHKIGRPTDFTIHVREFEWASGAGFVIPILGDIMRMPGLPSVPAAEGMDISNDGIITGLS